eukprot:scaffold7334_cov50-Attheya_sp.AAC.1
MRKVHDGSQKATHGREEAVSEERGRKGYALMTRLGDRGLRTHSMSRFPTPLPPEFHNCGIVVPEVDSTYVETTIPYNTLEQY